MNSSGPKLLLHVEGAAALIVAVVAYRQLGASWAEFAFLFLIPDLSLIGYRFGMKSGACVYNSVHTYVAPFLLATVGLLAGWNTVLTVCAIWVAHIGFDRLVGYGLKYSTGFKHTHLGRV